jgi:flagellar biosynthesis/type III secretory pathway M-ring protein FliF/YscJ
MNAHAYGGPPAGQAPPNNFMVGGILALLCCWPLGIPSLVFASRVNSSWNAGDHAGAYEAAAKARKWGITALVLGVISWIIFAVLWFTVLSALLFAADEAVNELEQIDEQFQEDMEELEDMDLEELEDMDLEELEQEAEDALEELEALEEELGN